MGIRDLRQTHTYVTLEVSGPTYDEIAKKLREADYGHCFMDDGEIDMHGLALVTTAYNEFCTEPPCASDGCRKARRCLHT